MLEKQEKRKKRHRKVRKKISGNSNRPRLSVFRSNKAIYAQIIDDVIGKTLASVNDSALEGKKIKKIDKAKEVGKLIAQKAKKIKIEKVVFDRGGYKYHGRVKALADGAREEGLKF